MGLLISPPARGTWGQEKSNSGQGLRGRPASRFADSVVTHCFHRPSLLILSGVRYVSSYTFPEVSLKGWTALAALAKAKWELRSGCS